MADVQLSLQNLLDTIAKQQNYDNCDIEITPISTGGGNYTSELFKVKITEQNKDELALFAKVASINGKMRDTIPITSFYETERFVYTELVKVYESIENENDLSVEHRMRYPKFYGCNPMLLEETVVLEDLSVQGFETHDRFKSIDWDYACKAVEELAKFHALSFAYAEKNPEEYANVLEKRKFEFKGDDEAMKAVWERMIGTVVNATREENRERLGTYMKENLLRVRDFYKPVRRPVLVHGDYRPSNLLHRTKEDGTLEIIPVDYQTVRSGSVATDLLYLVFTGTDEQFRSKHHDELVEEYYLQLCAALRRLHVDPEKVYPREDFDFEMKESLPFGLTIATFILPIVTVEAVNAPKMSDMNMTDWHVKTSQLFEQRVNGIIDDYVKWGVI